MDHSHKENDYFPLIAIFILLVVGALITSINDGIYSFILNFMTGFFLVFGGLKLLSLKDFVDGYASYDLLAKHVREYGYVYPFIELAFGFSMLYGFHPDWLLWSEAVLMLFGGIGVLIAMRKKSDIQCACLGNVLKVPLTKVSLVENFGMMILAITLILW